ncbi:hypothetical protein M378DRAFT_167642, partial [Amanita muscaria Koide BX008]
MAAVNCHSQNFANAGIPLSSLALVPADPRRQPLDEITSPRKSDRMMTLIDKCSSFSYRLRCWLRIRRPAFPASMSLNVLSRDKQRCGAL